MSSYNNFCLYIQERMTRRNFSSCHFVYNKYYKALCDRLIYCLKNSYKISVINSEDRLEEVLKSQDDTLVIIFNEHYDEIYKQLKKHNDFFIKHWKRTLKITGIGKHFSEVYAQSPAELSNYTDQIKNQCEAAQLITYHDDNDSYIEAHFTQKFTVIDGINSIDLVPGEIASYPDKISGYINFNGTFLSLIPFSLKYGVIQPNELIFNIKNNRIIDIKGTNTSLVNDLNIHFDKHPDNSAVDEFGIGTNKGVSNLYGTNSVFEERHHGLHLGLGGREKGSVHLDLLFLQGTIKADEKVLISTVLNN